MINYTKTYKDNVDTFKADFAYKNGVCEVNISDKDGAPIALFTEEQFNSFITELNFTECKESKYR